MNIAKFDILATLLDEKDSAIASINFEDTNALWLKFVFTDNQPNVNKQAVAEDEYPSIISTGTFKPFKRSEETEGHDGAVPIGTIVQMEQENEKVVGLASIWELEFPEIAQSIRKAHQERQPLNVSWELLFRESNVDEEGVEWLKGVSTRAVTLVKNPAYDGRTPVLAVAEKWSTAYVNDLPDSAFLYVESGGTKDEDGKTTPRSLRHLPYKDKEGNVDLEHLRNAIARASQVKGISSEKAKELQERARRILAKQEGKSSMELEQALEKIQELEGAKSALSQELEGAKASLEELVALKRELEDLRQYKVDIEEEKTRAALVSKRMQQFSEAGLTMTEEEFSAAADKWLSLDDEAFAFVLSQLVNQKPQKSGASASLNGGESNTNPTDDVALVKKFLEERANPPQSKEEK